MYFSGIRYVIILILFLFRAYEFYGQQVKSHRYFFADSSEKIQVLKSDDELIIYYRINQFHIQSVNTSEGDFYRLSIPGHNTTTEPGKPEVPVYSTLLSIPDGKVPEIKIKDIKTRIIYPARDNFRGKVFPRQSDQPKSSENQQKTLLIDKEIYGKKGFIISDTIKIENIGKTRNTNLANLMIYPVRYDPHDNRLEIITSMKLIISFSKGTSVNLRSESLPFIQNLSKGVLNYDTGDLITGYSEEPVKMVILTDTAFRKILNPYIKWKTQKGFRITTLYRGKGLAGNSFTELKDTLLKIYRYEESKGIPPEYLLIVGDVNRIPISDGTSNYTDLYYSTFDGTGDYLPEMFTGRLPVADTAELRAVVKKLIQYEKFEFADTNKYYTRTLLTAGNDDGHAVYMNGQLRYAEKYYINSSNNIENHIFYYPSSINARDSIIKLFNSGIGFVNYSGHGNAYGWLSPSLKSDDVVNFTNKNMYPFVISNACLTGQYTISNSFGNTLIKSSEKGAIGFIGCSNDSYWNEDFYWSVGVGAISFDPKYEETGLGAYDRLFHKSGEKASDWYITMGQINYAGNLSVTASTTQRKKYYWEIYNLMGDPSIIPYIGTPDTFKINLPDTLPDGLKSLSLTIEPYSYIAISHFDTLWDASFASPSGSVTLDLPGSSNDSCLIVVTGQNKIPLVKKVYIRNIDREYINLAKFELNDNQGNNNGKADYDEKIYIKLTVSNLGLSPAKKLFVKISSPSQELLTIENDSVYIGTIDGRSEIITDNQLLIKTAAYIPDRSYVTLNIKIGDSLTVKEYNKDIRLYAPLPEILNCVIDDSGSGNGDFIADPGESMDLIIKVRNRGSSPVSGVLKITDSPPEMNIHIISVPTGLLNPGDTNNVIIPVTLSPTIKKGSLINVSFLADCDPYYYSKTIPIPVGKILESFEYLSFNIFPWVNDNTYPWTITSGQSYDGNFSARSGAIPNNSESVLKLNVNIPHSDTISFMYKVSSEKNYDLLILRNNGNQIFSASGETEWLEKKIEIQEGFNILEWIYKKDQSVYSGSDCAWIDFIRFPPDAFNKIDLKTGKIISPVADKKLDKEVVSAEIINLGLDTIKQFNLAYTVNNKPPVTEIFKRTINPGDTVTVSFSTLVDMWQSGTYIINVYSFNNNDSYLNNDTASVTIINTPVEKIFDPLNYARVMPNPFSDRFDISIGSKFYEYVNAELIDITGNTLWKGRFELIPGDNVITITPGDITSGYYTLRIKGKTISVAVRLIKTD
ncbi:MAG TPA: C25 family cysteine peptidase [Bacteroidales bacterium]|nr:C25 family cysteine peptidase [Bacteroidales bacterium]HPP92722.1 C25 family cysteine peptidase [Bacteroidales bacterium]HQK70217.1 C25 family cysteine peptidase [Bacteroidales bacterium]HRT48221.1 C25 family cysteine peptidase [Bacteroidales bacterium]